MLVDRVLEEFEEVVAQDQFGEEGEEKGLGCLEESADSGGVSQVFDEVFSEEELSQKV